MADNWFWTNYIDDSVTTITAPYGGWESAELNDVALRDTRVGRVCRTVPPASTFVEIRIDLGTERTTDVFGIFGAFGFVSLQIFFGTAPNTGDLFSHHWTDPAGHPTGNYVLDLREAMGTDVGLDHRYMIVRGYGGYIQAGRIWLGPQGWQPVVGHTYGGSERQMADLSLVSRSPRSGAVLADTAARRRIFTASYDALASHEYNGVLETLDRNVGLTRQVLFVPEPDVYDIKAQPVLGYLRELTATRFTGYLRASRELTIVEAG